MTSKFSQLKYPSLSPSFYLSLPHTVSQSLTPSCSVSTVSLQSLPSKKEAVGGSLPPPHNESIQSTSEEKHLTGSALSSHKTKKGKGEMERKKRARQTRNQEFPLLQKSSFMTTAASSQREREKLVLRVCVSIKEVEI